jgi:glutamate/tyrosine decarboxylase-like PLP-dependent enzyme
MSSCNYKRTVIHSTEMFEIVSIEWNNSDLSDFHDHGPSQCMIKVENGTFENHLDLGYKTELQIIETGQVLSTPVGAKHKMRCLTQAGKTLHVYSPRIKDNPDEARFYIPSLSKFCQEINLSDASEFGNLLNLLDQVRNHSISVHSPYFMNQLFSGISPLTLLAQRVISETKATLATYEASPALTAIESEVIEALGELIGWPKNHRDGVVVPGGSAANFMAIHCSRHKSEPAIKTAGLRGERFRIFVSKEAHYSFKKASAVLGLGTDSIVSVAVDSSGCMNTSELKALIEDSRKDSTPLMVVATAGTTVRGAFDPIHEIADICQEHNIWLHVDGAWGGPALFTSQLKNLVSGIERADSVAFDAHKLFGADLTCSFFLTKHKDLLLCANDVSGGEYLFHQADVCLDRGKLSWQCGRSADALSFWTIWKSLGTKGLGQFVDELISLRNQTLSWMIDRPRLQLISMPTYLNICVRVIPPDGQVDIDWSKRVRESLRESNLAMVNYSHDDNGTFLRLILAHPFLKFEHIQKILQHALAVK